ncbi:hypothetical protein HPO96_34205 [Kribbella sandramycini]|uniref:Sialidase domain-containing protein n=1 Tax=Kribbella sandramycini TaxID=60450 RepID=A0A7Y4L6L2_9ACTN|nr:sialidase family protein [Kribbella sandramycini]MBB6570454.1 hypothetical protein [Kribbella sandramycini]NOL45314.1 hypothetical protein [Kribbella sandramycini]
MRLNKWSRRLLIGVLAFVLSLATSVVASANDPGYQLHTFTNPDERGLAARVIRLQHAGAQNGTLISTFEHWIPNGFPTVPYLIKRSVDDGATWSTIATLEDGETGAGRPWPVKWTPTLLELPAAAGGFPAGTLLMVGLVWNPFSGQAELQLWRSTNQGVNWTYGGVIQSGGKFYEPFLYIDGAGRVVVVFADERQHPTFNQKVVQITSADGGTTWSPVQNVLANGNGVDRPGMAVVTKLPDNTYRMVFEVCGVGTPGCQVRIKQSADGANWGSPTDYGTRPEADGRFLTSGPYVTWAPGDTPAGQLIVSGAGTWRTVDNQIFGPENYQTLFVSYDLGATWHRMPTPFRPAGNYPEKGPCAEPDGTNWSGTLLPSADGSSIRWMTSGPRAGSIQCNAWTQAANVGTIPRSDTFASGNGPGWINYGGAWGVSSGAYRETSGGGSGTKSLTGSTGWTNYTVAADVTQSSSGGDAGVLFRVTNPNIGTDAHRGYYAGIGVGGTLFIGKQDYNYSTLGAVPVTGGVTTGTAYRVTVTAKGSQLTATVRPAGASTPVTTLTVNDSSFLTGQVGIRNLDTAAAFDNFTVDAIAAPNLPASATFGTDEAGWIPYGGAWQVAGGTYQQTSTASEAKSLIGRATWSNYTTRADVSIGGSTGDAGVLFRASNPGVGTDKLRGYYAGISTGGNLFIGKQNQNYTTLGITPISGGVTANSFYRVSLGGSGSSLTATVTPPGGGAALAALTVTDATFTAGLAGVRTFDDSAQFDNVSIT